MTETSPRNLARLGGLFYLLMTLASVIGRVGRAGLIIANDASATAANILAHQPMFILGFAGDVLVIVTYAVVVALFYRIFRPVNKTVALSAAFIGLMGCAAQCFTSVFLLAPLSILGGATYLTAFNPDQLHALAFLSLKVYSQAYAVGLVFFGFYNFLNGYLVYRSTFMPRIVGLLLMLGVTWVAFLAPPFALKYFPLIVAGSIGELVLMLWLLFKGVDEEKWRERAAAGGT